MQTKYIQDIRKCEVGEKVEETEKNEKCHIYRESGNVYIVGCDCQYCKHTSEWDKELGQEYHYYECVKYGYYWEGIL